MQGWEEKTTTPNCFIQQGWQQLGLEPGLRQTANGRFKFDNFSD